MHRFPTRMLVVILLSLLLGVAHHALVAQPPMEDRVKGGIRRKGTWFCCR